MSTDPDLPEHALAALRAFEGMLAERAIPMGLIAASDAGRIWERHVLDSLAALPAFRAEDASAVDMGSGAGLPGIPLAIALPHVRFVLAESRSRRVGFLEHAVRELGVANAEVHHGRVQDLGGGAADVATARAFAPIAASWVAALPLLRPEGRLAYYAGRGLDDPEREAAGLTPRPGRVSVLESHGRVVMMART